MSKSSTASVSKNPTPLPAKSAWLRGPPLSATVPSPRSQSPALPSATPIHQTHSRRPSALGQAVPIKDGVSVPRSNVGAVKPGSAVTFGSINDASSQISTSPASAPVIKSSEGVRSFGTVPATAPTSSHVNGKPSISSRPQAASAASSTTSLTSIPSTTGSATSSSTTATTAATTDSASSKRKIDVKSFFQSTPSAPTSTHSSDASSPALRNTHLPPQPSAHQAPSSHTPSQLSTHSYPNTFVPHSMRPPQHGGSNGTPRSPSYSSRPMQNGGGPRSQGVQGGPPGGLGSPRIGPHPQSSGLPPLTPQMQTHMQPPMQMSWQYYYPEQPYMYGWYPQAMPMQSPHGPQPPTSGIPPHSALPMSPRNPSTSLHNPGTPTMAHAHPSPVHPPPPISHPSNSIGGLTPPSNPPSTTLPPTNRLNATSSSFVPQQKKVTVKNQDGVELTLGNLKPPSASPVTNNAAAPPSFRQASPGTPNRRPASIRIETEEQRNQRVAEENEKARLKAEAEETAKREKEDAERKVKEAQERKKREDEAEKERIRKEAEEKEKERLKKLEDERLKKEAEEREAQQIREEEARKRKEEEDTKRLAEEQAKKEQEQRLQRDKEAKEREEKERAEQERAEQLAKEAEAETLRLEHEVQRKVAEADALAQDGKAEDQEDGEIVEESPKPLADVKEKGKEILRIDTKATALRRHPGHLDLTDAKKSNIPAPQSALATARVISDINAVSYPEGVSSPNPMLNQHAKDGKFRYDRDFLLQFMLLCKEKPPSLPPLEMIGLEPNDSSSLHLTRGGSGRHRTSSSAIPPARQASIGLGFSPSTLGKGTAGSFNQMGSFATQGGSKLNSEDRFAISNRAVSVTGTTGMPFARPIGLTRTASSGPGRERTRSKRGEKRNESNRVASGVPASVGLTAQHNGNFEPVAPLQATANRWDRKAFQADADSPEMVDRKVKSLLNKLTMEKFDSISDQIIQWANKSENEKDGRTLIQVIKLVFEKATDEAAWSEMYARLCRKMMEQISSKVQDDGIKNNDGKPIAGGQLFRKYLLNRCQEDFERGWVAKEATAAAAATKALEDKAVKAANEEKGEQKEEHALYSEEYYAAQKAKRRGLGLIRFIGELYKLQMLTERIMHECVKKLLGNVDNPEEEEIESLCKLLSTVGGDLDTQKARAHMDVYFSRMKELTKSPHVTSRMQFMLQDVLELRERKWISRGAHAMAAPTTLAQVHEAAAKEKAAQEKEAHQRQHNMSRVGSRRGGDRGDHLPAGPDGWAVAGSNPSRQLPKAGDLSNFGKIKKDQPITFGPSSVFTNKKPDSKLKEPISRTASSTNKFSMLSSQNAENGDATLTSVEPQRKRIVLQPRSKPVESTEPTETPSPVAESESSGEEAPSAAIGMSEESALKKATEDTKEFFNVRNIEEDAYFTDLPPKFRSKLVEKLVGHVVEAKEVDAQLLADFFARAVSKGLCSPEAFEEGFVAIAEIIDDVLYDAPKALDVFAIALKGASLDKSRLSNIASKSPLLELSQWSSN